MSCGRRFGFSLLSLSILLIVGLASGEFQAAEAAQNRVYVTTGEGQDALSRHVTIDVQRSGRGYLGVSLDEVTAENKAQLGLAKEEGALVQDVEKGGPAAEAGIQKSDVIMSYAGFPVFSAAQLARLVSETPVGRKVEVAVMRGGKRVNLEAKIAQRDAKSETALQLPGRPDRPILRFRGGESEVFDIDPLIERFRLNTTVRPRLGVSVIELGDQLAEKYGLKGKEGVLVTSVTAGSPADKAGVKAGDVITEVNGRSVSDAGSLTRQLQRLSDGDGVDLKIYRDGKPLSLKAQLEGAAKKPGSANRVIL